MVLCRKGRERALMGRRSGWPSGPSASAGLSGARLRVGARRLPESRMPNSRGVRMAGIPLLRFPWDRRRPRRHRPWRRAVSLASTRSLLCAGRSPDLRGSADFRNGCARPRPVVPELPERPRPANPAIAHPRSRIRAPRRSAAPPGSPGSLLSRAPARPASRNSRNPPPAIPERGAAPGSGVSAGRSRSLFSPEARTVGASATADRAWEARDEGSRGREIAESAFRDFFGGVDVVAADVKPDTDPLDGDPAPQGAFGATARRREAGRARRLRWRRRPRRRPPRCKGERSAAFPKWRCRS